MGELIVNCDALGKFKHMTYRTGNNIFELKRDKQTAKYVKRALKAYKVSYVKTEGNRIRIYNIDENSDVYAIINGSIRRKKVTRMGRIEQTLGEAVDSVRKGAKSKSKSKNSKVLVGALSMALLLSMGALVKRNMDDTKSVGTNIRFNEVFNDEPSSADSLYDIIGKKYKNTFKNVEKEHGVSKEVVQLVITGATNARSNNCNTLSAGAEFWRDKQVEGVYDKSGNPYFYTTTGNVPSNKFVKLNANDNEDEIELCSLLLKKYKNKYLGNETLAVLAYYFGEPEVDSAINLSGYSKEQICSKLNMANMSDYLNDQRFSDYINYLLLLSKVDIASLPLVLSEMPQFKVY